MARQYLLWVILLLMKLGLQGALGQELETELESKAIKDMKTKQEIASLYTSMAPKSAPLYLCDPEFGGIEYRPPTAMECNSEPSDNDTTSVINISLFWNDLSSHTIPAYECSGTIEKYSSFYWLMKFYDEEIALQSIKINAKDCWKMVESKTAPNGEKFKRISDQVWETDKQEIAQRPNWYMTATWYVDVINYRIQEVRVGISEVDGSIRTTASTNRPCHYNETFCATSIGLLVWKESDVRTCRLLEGEQSNCFLRVGQDGKTITCPDLQLSLHGFNHLKMCGVWFGYSNGIYFLQNKRGSVDHKLATPKQIRHLITSPRIKREASGVKIHQFEAEMKANLNYLYDTLKKGTSDAYYRLEKKICELQKSQLDMVSSLAQSGYPSLSTRSLYKDPSLRAEYVGDLLTVYKCVEVREYRFLQREFCTYQWPVEYVYGHTVYQGFMEPHSHTIIPQATNQTVNSFESCKKFYLQTEDYVVLLTNDGAVQVYVDTLPFSGTNHHRDHLPELTFIPYGTLKASDEKESMYYLLKEIQQRNMKSRPGTNQAKHLTIKKSSSFFSGAGSLVWDAFSGIGSFTFSIFDSIKKFLLYTLLLFLGVVLFCILLSSGLLCQIIKLPFLVVACTLKAKKLIKKLLKCAGLRKNIKKGLRLTKRTKTEEYTASAPMLYGLV